MPYTIFSSLFLVGELVPILLQETSRHINPFRLLPSGAPALFFFFWKTHYSEGWVLHRQREESMWFTGLWCINMVLVCWSSVNRTTPRASRRTLGEHVQVSIRPTSVKFVLSRRAIVGSAAVSLLKFCSGSAGTCGLCLWYVLGLDRNPFSWYALNFCLPHTFTPLLLLSQKTALDSNSTYSQPFVIGAQSEMNSLLKHIRYMVSEEIAIIVDPTSTLFSTWHSQDTCSTIQHIK